MSIDTAITRFRSRQAAQFSQTADVHRPVGEPVYDEGTKEVTQPVETLYEDLACKVTATDHSGQDAEAGETEVRIVDLMVKFPVGTDVAKDDIVTITASVYNPLGIGKQYRITDVDEREWQISRRCAIEETLVPMSWGGS